MSKFRPGLTIKDFNCLSRHLGFALGIFFLSILHQKMDESLGNGIKKKKRNELTDHWHVFQHVNVTINDVNMSRLQGQYQCF